MDTLRRSSERESTQLLRQLYLIGKEDLITSLPTWAFTPYTTELKMFVSGHGNDVNWIQNEKSLHHDIDHLLGEPSFRSIRNVDLELDLPYSVPKITDLVKHIVHSLPQLVSIHLMVKPLRAENFIESVLSLCNATQSSNARFDVCLIVDIDDIDYQDSMRETLDFQSLLDKYQTLKRYGITASIKFEFSPFNCYYADDFLLICEQHGITNFDFDTASVADSFADSHGLRGVCNNYSQEQLFHTLLFVDKLSRRPDISFGQRMLYLRMAKASSTDQYLSKSVPRSKKSMAIIKMNGAGEISYSHVPIHNTNQRPTSAEIFHRGIEILSKRQIQRRSIIRPEHIFPKSIYPAEVGSPSGWRSVLITGWYGTETTGDKAILGELLHFLKTSSPQCQVTLTTIDPKISRQTRNELPDLQDTDLVAIDQGYDPKLIDSVDAVIIGGGPLMESQRMETVCRIFQEANRQRKARVIFGCGIGPLHSDRMHQLTRAILRMTTAGFFRDEESYEYAAQHMQTDLMGFACDPSLAFIQRWVESEKNKYANPGNRLRLIGLLRANTGEFIAGASKLQVDEFNRQNARKIAQMIDAVSSHREIDIELLPMNCPWIGGDDRLFNRLVAGEVRHAQTVQIERRYLPLFPMLAILQAADISIVMRYHGHLFSTAMGIPFLSINYSGKEGKVERFVTRIGYRDFTQDWSMIDANQLEITLQRLIDEKDYWSTYLRHQTDLLVNKLSQIYEHVFNIPGGIVN